MQPSQPFRLDSKIFLGLGIILFGAAALLDNLGIIEGYSLWVYWPVLLMLAGLSQLLQPRAYRQQIWGALLIVAGGLILVRNLGYLHFSLWDLWPVVLIVVGLRILGGRLSDCCRPGALETERISICAIMGGGEFRFVSKQLRGGTLTAIMGGCTVDLREADMAGDTLVLDTFAFWGGIDIIVPLHWRVTMDGVPLMGGMDCTPPPPDAPPPLPTLPVRNLIVRGVAIMGGVEVKHSLRPRS